jgi:hypothetical protein
MAERKTDSKYTNWTWDYCWGGIVLDCDQEHGVAMILVGKESGYYSPTKAKKIAQAMVDALNAADTEPKP